MRTSNGYLSTSDGWEDLRSDFTLDWSYRSAPNWNVVQTAQTPLTGRRGRQDLTLALAFGDAPGAATAAASASLAAGFFRSFIGYAACRGSSASRRAPCPSVRPTTCRS